VISSLSTSTQGLAVSLLLCFSNSEILTKLKKCFKNIRSNRNPDIIDHVPKRAIWPRRGALTWNDGVIGVAPVTPGQSSSVAVVKTNSKAAAVLFLTEQTPLKHDNETEF